jgi:hypothetical protein
MQDYRTTRDFRKGYIGNKIAEDPTYLSFFFMFDYYTEESPLFNGEAVDYLENVVGDAARAESLKNFIKILQRVNSEMPWIWQGVTGLDAVRQYGNLEEPFWGASKPALEIECLENVELTVSGMIDLYKRAAYDFNRWVEVLPKNLQRFRLMVWVSEVRTFGKNIDKPTITQINQESISSGSTSDQSRFAQANIDSNSIKDIRPFFKVTLGRCRFDIDSANSIFTDLKRTPDGPTSTTIKIFWETMEEEGEYANNVIAGQQKRLGEMVSDVTTNKFVDRLKSKASTLIESTIDRTIESTRAKLLLGNVHGVNLLSTVQDAIAAGSINGIANLIGSKPNRPTPSGDLGGAFDAIPTRSTTAIKENVYGDPPSDSEGPINANVYDRVPSDLESPINTNVYDRTTSDPEGPINANVHK